MAIDRRLQGHRAAIVRSVADQYVQHVGNLITVEQLRESFNIPEDAASRIVASLGRAGVINQVRDGVWITVVP